jgi:excisionase family DNA binding protein
MSQILLSRYAAADALGVSFMTVDRLVKDGKLRCTKIGRRVLFAQADLEKFAATARKDTK